MPLPTVLASAPGAVPVTCRRVVSVRTGALPVVVAGGLAAHRCRVGLLYGLQCRRVLLYAIRIVSFALRAGPSEAPVRPLCSTWLGLQFDGFRGRSRSTANRVRGGGADASSVPYSDGSAWSVTACDRVLFSTRWGCPRRYRFRRRCCFPRRRVAAVRRAVWRPAWSLRCAPGCGLGVRFRNARVALYGRGFSVRLHAFGGIVLDWSCPDPAWCAGSCPAPPRAVSRPRCGVLRRAQFSSPAARSSGRACARDVTPVALGVSPLVLDCSRFRYCSTLRRDV